MTIHIAFQCLHVWKEPQEKTNLFDPTPPPQRGPGQIKHKVGDCPDVFGRSDYPQNMGQYIVTSKCLGSGAFATVHLAIDPSNHRQVACKTICARRKKDKRQVLLEVEMLKRVRHVSLLALDHRLFPDESSPTSTKSMTASSRISTSCMCHLLYLQRE